jgi:ABC-type Fe3+ transport system permease subunit
MMVWTKPAINVIWGLAGVFILLILATLIIQLLSLTLPEKLYRTEATSQILVGNYPSFSTSLILSPGIAVIFLVLSVFWP